MLNIAHQSGSILIGKIPSNHCLGLSLGNFTLSASAFLYVTLVTCQGKSNQENLIKKGNIQLPHHYS